MHKQVGEIDYAVHGHWKRHQNNIRCKDKKKTITKTMIIVLDLNMLENMRKEKINIAVFVLEFTKFY